MVRTPLFDPDAFFREREVGLGGAALVVLAVGVASIAGGVPVAREAYPEASAAALAAAVLLGGLVGGTVAWVVATALVHLVSAPFGGEGAFDRTLAYVGWGFLPGAFAGLLTATAAFAAVGAPPALLLAAEVGFGLWQGYIWTYAAVHARRVDRAAALAAAAVSVAGSVALAASGAFG